MEHKESVVIRAAVPTDMPLIYRSILMGTYHGNKYAKSAPVDPKAPNDYFSSIPQDVFMFEYHKYLDGLFDSAQTETRIACLQSEPDVILGFSVTKGSTLNFVFVKPHWRHIGIGTMLIPVGITTASGFTRVGDIIRRKKGWIFNPWA